MMVGAVAAALECGPERFYAIGMRWSRTYSLTECRTTLCSNLSIETILDVGPAGRSPSADGLPQSFQQPFQMRHALA